MRHGAGAFNATAEKGDNTDLGDLMRRLRICAALTLPLLWSLVDELLPALNPMILPGERAAV